MAELGIQVRIGFFRDNPHREIVDHLHPVDDSLQGSLLQLVLGVNDSFQAEFYGGGVTVFTVVKFYAFAQLEFPGQVIDQLVRRGQ
ncbi:MAG: hypothetical protein NTY64_09030 [Deltaproteobacteria bacterium]|nr:hypothetical protein [Deltaproteobacteria bacterium]